MKRLSVLMAVVLGLALIFPVVGLAQGGKPEYKATGGVTLDIPYVAKWTTFSFTAQNLGDGNLGRGKATWIDHKPFNHDFDIMYKIVIDYAEYVDSGEMKFGGSVVETNNPYVNIGDKIYFWVVDGGSPGKTNDWVNVSWDDLSTFTKDGFTVVGGNLVVHE